MINFCQFGAGRIGAIHAGNLVAHPDAHIGIVVDPDRAAAERLAARYGAQVGSQAEAYEYPEAFFAPRCWRIRRPPPDPRQLADAAATFIQARAPLIIAGGGVHYALACETLADFATRRGVPVAETQAGKGALA